jgi:hypothetical protein
MQVRIREPLEMANSHSASKPSIASRSHSNANVEGTDTPRRKKGEAASALAVGKYEWRSAFSSLLDFPSSRTAQN